MSEQKDLTQQDFLSTYTYEGPCDEEQVDSAKPRKRRMRRAKSLSIEGKMWRIMYNPDASTSGTSTTKLNMSHLHKPRSKSAPPKMRPGDGGVKDEQSEECEDLNPPPTTVFTKVMNFLK